MTEAIEIPLRLEDYMDDPHNKTDFVRVAFQVTMDLRSETLFELARTGASCLRPVLEELGGSAALSSLPRDVRSA